jgi:hypothetical protein
VKCIKIYIIYCTWNLIKFCTFPLKFLLDILYGAKKGCYFLSEIAALETIHTVQINRNILQTIVKEGTLLLLIKNGTSLIFFLDFSIVKKKSSKNRRKTVAIVVGGYNKIVIKGELIDLAFLFSAIYGKMEEIGRLEAIFSFLLVFSLVSILLLNIAKPKGNQTTKITTISRQWSNS